MRNADRDENIVIARNRNDFLRSRARQLQRMLGGWSRTVGVPPSTNLEGLGRRLLRWAGIVKPHRAQHHRYILSNTGGHSKVGEQPYAADTANLELRWSEHDIG